MVRVFKESDSTIGQVAKDFGVSASCLQRWLAQDADAGRGSGSFGSGRSVASESAELRDAKKRIRLLEQEKEVLRKGGCLLRAVQLAGDMMYPLVRELAAEDAPVRVPVAVTCPVLNIARQPYYRWLKNPITTADVAEAYLANAVFDAHRDDPEFGYRLVFDELRAAGHRVCERTVWRICSANGWWSPVQQEAREERQDRSAREL